MRKVIVANIVSLDGFYEGPNHNVMALPLDGSFDAFCVEHLRKASTLLLGRRSYDLFRGFWPGMAERAEATPAQRDISRLDDALEKVVVSDGLDPAATAPWTTTTRVLRRAEAHQRIAELRAGDGGDLLMFGSRTLWNDLLAAGLVDELHLMIGAVVLGGGTPAFAVPCSSLRLLDVRSTAGSSNIVVQYAAR